jgi:hypothetical protein
LDVWLKKRYGKQGVTAIGGEFGLRVEGEVCRGDNKKRRVFEQGVEGEGKVPQRASGKVLGR